MKKNYTLATAIQFAADYKIKATDRSTTHKGYNIVCKRFIAFLEQNNYTHLLPNDFSTEIFYEWTDSLLFSGLQNVTQNGYNGHLRTICNFLIQRKIMTTHPIHHFKKKEQPCKRRAFSDEEKIIVFDYIRKTDKWLMLNVALQYYCFIRPSAEQRRLKFSDFDLKEGIIYIRSEVGKNRIAQAVTIPDDMLPLFAEVHFDTYPKHWLIFGKEGQPNAEIPLSQNTMNYRHVKVLNYLFSNGLLTDIVGLTLYSWKNTGNLSLVKKKVSMLEIMNQNRHQSLDQTQRYCKSLYSINSEIKSTHQLATV